jgi:uncharacterized protein (TIGR02453 family)
MTAPFPGFPPDAMDFLAALKANNDRTWFAANRATYERAIRGPTEAFVAVITPRLEALTATPVTAKVFRLHRDVRFSKDKSPYNAHLHIGFAAGDRQSGSGFYFGLEPDRLHLGAGAFEFGGRVLDSYRAAAGTRRPAPRWRICWRRWRGRGFGSTSRRSSGSRPPTTPIIPGGSCCGARA